MSMQYQANPNYKDFNAYLPFKPETGDSGSSLIGPLSKKPGSFEDMPESAGSDQEGDGSKSPADQPRVGSDETVRDDEQGNIVLEKIDDIFTNMNCPESVKLNRLKTWLRKIRRTMAVDIDRVARYAVLKGCREVVTYLSDREKADLKSRDVLGRSAIFYAASCMEFPMLETVTSIVGDQIVQAEMDRHDSCGFYPLHYAVEFSSIEVIEFCLLHGADVDTLSLGLLARLAEPAFSVLLELYRRPRPYLEYPIHIVSYGRRSKVWGYEKIKGVQAFLVTEARKTTTNAKSVTWIHVPWTNGLVAFAALWSLQKATKDPEVPGQPHIHLEWFVQSFCDPPTVPGNPSLNYREPIYETHDRSGPDMEDKPALVSIVFPCLVLQDVKSFGVSRGSHQSLWQPTPRGLPRRLIQTNRTLDEAYYPSLDDQVLGERNKDQVVTKECKKSLDGQILFEGQKPILMVSQLWIWRVDDWILSAYSEPGENPAGFDPEITSRAEVVLNRSLLVDQMIDSSKKGSCPEAVIGLLLAQQIDRFGKPQRVDEFGELRLIYQSPLDIFEIGVVRILSSVSKYINDNTSETLDITKERQFIHDISDIRSELAMIDEILSQQEEIMGNFIKDARRYFNVAKVVATQRQLERFRKRVTKIDKDAERIEKTIQDQLNLKRTHASIEDAHASVVIGQASLEFGRTSAILGMAVIGFATITIIFAPMAFVASLLALPIDIFDAHKVGDSKSYPTGYLGGWFVVAELVTLVVTGLAILVSVWFLNNRTVKKSKAKEEGSKTGVGEKKAASEGGKEEGEKKTWHSKMAMFRGLRKRPKNNELHGDDESRPGT